MQTPAPNTNVVPSMPTDQGTPPTQQNLQKFLDFLGKAEGADYNVIVGGKKFQDFSRHPGVVGLRTKEGPSTAAGKYQITQTTYNDIAPRLGIKDFSPESQDRIAIELIRQKGAFEDVQKGDFRSAIDKLGATWASLPSSPYTQPKRSWEFAQTTLGVPLGTPTQRTQVAARTQKATAGASPTAKKGVQFASLGALPESYRTALALNFIADSDPEDEVISKAIEVLRTTQEDTGAAKTPGGDMLQKYVRGQEGVDPFQFLERKEEPEPRLRRSKMRNLAQGGPVYRQSGSPPQGERAVPSMAEVPVIGPDGRLMLPEEVPERELSPLEKLRGAVETGATMVTGAVAAPIAAVTGLARGKNIKEANVEAGKVLEAMTYQPRSEAGRRYLEAFGKAMQESKLDALLPQTQLMNVRVAPGAARYLGEQAKGKVEEAVMPGLRERAGDPNLTPEQVYGAMLGKPSEVMAQAGASYATRPLGKDVDINKVQKVDPKAFISATEELDAIPITPEVEQILDAHIGGVGNFGDPDAKYYLMHVPGGAEYTQQAQNVAQKYFGDQFMGYRLMPEEEFEALKSGDVGNLLSFSLSKDAADAFRKFAPNQGREDLVLAEVPLTPSHVLGFGHRGEQEIIVNTSVGWSMDAFRRARPSLTPSEDYPFIGELESRVDELSGPVKKQTLLGMLKGRPHDIRRAKEALEDFGPNDYIEPDQIISALRRTSPQRYQLQIIQASNEGRSGWAKDYDNPYPDRPIGAVNLLLEPGQLQKQLSNLSDDIEDWRSSSSASKVFTDPAYSNEYFAQLNNFADQVDEFDPQLARAVKMRVEDAAKEVKPYAELTKFRSYATYPVTDPKNSWLVNWNDPEKTVPQEVKDLIRSRGVSTITPQLASIAAKELAARRYLKEFKDLVDSKKDVYTFNYMLSRERDRLNEITSSPEAFLEDAPAFKFYYQDMDMLQKDLSGAKQGKEIALLNEEINGKINSVLSDYDYLLTTGKNQIINGLRRLSQDLLDSDTVMSGKFYRGSHKDIVNKNPISFSRFVELGPNDFTDVPPELKGQDSAVLFTELQSDRRRDLKRMRAGLVEEPYPSFAEDADLLRELMVKSAVAGAAKLGKNIALFPAADSKKPELYGTWKTKEAKDDRDMTQYYPTTMQRITEKVAKDLGEGYEAKEFNVINAQGVPIVRWGIVLPDDAAQTMSEKGIGFAEGGLVELLGEEPL